ncbi:THxN family PEP-CTERM protein [Kineobactrum salinum]|uniref:PEP-CTERM sorting domain-containing protein n=1 Tax=Kineobactrum salinum TaxID=2708301 RepID=A0A6C0U5M2_9GAMM|nr:THxN family PEP-CTERM protein [Kineobactrum salinum]QIB64744.1 PEP-CTERM sorting domain-containing protein [Kineobactrum salinum]
MKTSNFAKGLVGAFALAGASLLSTGASAAIIEWDYEVVTTWDSAVFSPGNGDPIQNDTEISWGATGGSIAVPGGNRSALLVDNTLSTGSVFTNGPVAPTTVVTHNNNSISSSFATLTDAMLTTTLNLVAADPDEGQAFNDSITFNVQFTETLNEGPCEFASDSVCDDIFVISFESLNNSFDFQGETYFISVVTLGGALVPLPNATCAAAGAANGCFGFTTPEDEATSVPFGILITQQPVPAPGALALMGLGLLGLGYSRRRKLAA